MTSSNSAIVTSRLKLIPHAPEHLRALIQGDEAYAQCFGSKPANGLRDMFVSKDVSAEYVARLQVATAADPWTIGFVVVHRATDLVIGGSGFKGPPSTEGIVEIAYGIVPDFQGKGYATEAAEALVAFAFESDRVRLILAHTLPTGAASKRVLEKCGFKYVGDVVDPDDGPVSRFERQRTA